MLEVPGLLRVLMVVAEAIEDRESSLGIVLSCVDVSVSHNQLPLFISTDVVTIARSLQLLGRCVVIARTMASSMRHALSLSPRVIFPCHLSADVCTTSVPMWFSIVYFS